MKKLFPLLITVVICLTLISCSGQSNKKPRVDSKVNLTPPAGKAVAAFAEGCFWCSEHIFEAVVGVDSAISGYAGGKTINPTYELVNTETTGHAETVLVYYDPKVVSYAELLNVFLRLKTPLHQIGKARTEGIRIAPLFFYSNAQEKELAEKAKLAYGPSFKNPIVSEIKPLTAFYKAEEYHQDYIEHNSFSSYVMRVSIPRFELFKKTFKGKLKKGS